MVNTKRIQEMKELGIVERKREETGELEYTFKLKCRRCGRKVEWCYCTGTLDEVKGVLAQRQDLCEVCWRNPEEMPEDALRKICADVSLGMEWDDAVDAYLMEQAEMWAGEPRELDDGTEFWTCECPMEFQEEK